jgi:cytochrome c553
VLFVPEVIIGISQGDFMKSKSFAFVLAISAACAWGGEESAKVPAIAGQVCATCHGADGNSLIPVNPKLAGQHAGYIAKQLTEFKSGKRANPVMAGMAAMLSKDDVKSVADYFASQKPGPGAARDRESAALGQSIFRGGIPAKGIPSCSSCHSPNGAGVPALFPRLSGQHADYTSVQLKSFRAGERANDENSVMRTVAARLTDQEITQLSEYIAGLH